MEPEYIEGTLIEGVADDIVFSLIIFTIFIAVFIVLIIKCSSRPGQIHPDSQENISSARLRLRQQNLLPDESHSPPNHLNCPICLGELHFAVETNCGHIFCGNCLITYWRFGNWLGKIQCPICRQGVSIILFNFTEAETNTASDARRDIVGEINGYNRRFSGEPRPWIDYVLDLPTMLRYAFSELFSLEGLVYVFQVRVGLCLIIAVLYFLIPFDLVPEGVFGILGFLDDFFIMFMLAVYITVIYRRLVEVRAAGEEA